MTRIFNADLMIPRDRRLGKVMKFLCRVRRDLSRGTSSGTLPGMTNHEKIRENRLRRMAARQGYRLVKSRRRDPQAWDYGTYFLADAQTSGLATDQHASLDDVEAFLTR